MKTKIEEAAEKYRIEWDFQGNRPDEECVQSFIAGADFMQGEVEKLKLKDVEIMELEKFKDAYNEVEELYFKSNKEIKALEKKLKVAIEALEIYRLMGVGNTIADEALAAIKDSERLAQLSTKPRC